MSTSSDGKPRGGSGSTAGAVRRSPVTLIILIGVGVAACLGVLDLALALVGATDETAAAIALSLTTLFCAILLRRLGWFPTEMFGRSTLSRLLATIVGVLMLALVGLRGALPISEDVGSKLLLGPSAFFEEILFRGVPLLVLMRSGHSRLAKVGGIVAASAIFSVLHPSQHVVMYLDMFVFALVAFWMSSASRSIWPAVIFHVLANVTAITVASPLYDSDARGLFVFVDLGLFLGIWLAGRVGVEIVRRKGVSS